MGAFFGKALLWCALLAGLIGSGIAVYALHVNGAVGSLIVASVAGLVLLRLRADVVEGEPGDEAPRDAAVT
ncbi:MULTISPECIES: hypothetical protein [unclassified Rhodococcus (in: high G+C Gram-positive bacteria)]|uniref:hypothetical protein n=1 Tax=Rhodococcus sp. SJ-3 TaxID=3454628 RepID=UPI002D8CC070|nr:hypothetical protein [Rhodococcus sp. (in: high G+C Gram-positive bacteria)]